MSNNQNLAALEHELNANVLKGDILGAFEKFYAETIVMQENMDPPCAGKDANRVREKAFVDSVQQIHKFELLGCAIGEGVTYSEWFMDISFKNGVRSARAQVSARRWKNGQVVHERFYYH